jgi:hypothetical protein
VSAKKCLSYGLLGLDVFAAATTTFVRVARNGGARVTWAYTAVGGDA